jgi:hypothetical protein
MTVDVTVAAVRPAGRRPVPWLSVGVLSVVLSLGNGFWLESIQGAVGSIERAQGPFLAWLEESLVLVPVFALAILAMLALARRWFGPDLRRLRPVIAAAMLIAAAGTVLGIGEVAASSGYDYYLQSHELSKVQLLHFHTTGTSVEPGLVNCNATCQAKRATLIGHARALRVASPMILATNVLLAGWMIALCGGRLEPDRTRGRSRRDLV